ncbi:MULTISPECIES: ethanolamine ammonia-lyase subunit EutC [Rhizobiaceae]|jgi:ethanolamine ammonia-lyase small subunit|uniref:Ethanolamine ammonia-lyase small subunit n=1 Tax=Shinella sumterensis TaxID=1967501 RepID=A0AA50CVS6_9HYPH|nr:ethanolamine ammonia-lyase subunit EutC [Shinella sumterensis]WLS01455.1 ethanolamine ammonia-lyase subunit EutC [Shinella sumterensis]
MKKPVQVFENDPRPAGDRALDFKAMTDARVALGRFGSGLPTRATQAFLLDHARAREAVWTLVDNAAMEASMADLGVEILTVESSARERNDYVRRPDLGRRLSDRSIALLAELRTELNYDVVIVVGDGLSASAVTINAKPLIAALLPLLRGLGLSLGPLVLASQARVALADPIGEALNSRVTIMLIGERPGLSASDSLGAYITYAPKPGTPDSARNCVSNIRDGGLSISEAAEAIVSLVGDMMRTHMSGVTLKAAVALLPDGR